MKRLILVRHGETEWNAARRLQGQTDIALSDRGRAQARALIPLVSDLRPDLAMVSDLRRAMETASALGFAGATPSAGLREQFLGQWEGRAIADIRAEAPEDYRGWRAGLYAPPGGEAWAAFRARVEVAMLDGLSHCRSTALIVAHGGVIRAALDALIGLPPSRIIPVGPGSLCILAHDGNDFRLEAFNVSGGMVELHAPD